MSRYIYDEVKKDFEEKGIIVNPNIIIDSMAIVTKNMGYDYPGQIPEAKLDDFKDEVKVSVTIQIRRRDEFMKKYREFRQRIRERLKKRESAKTGV